MTIDGVLDSGTGIWRVGDPAGRRQFAGIGTLPLEMRGALPDVTMAYETWGRLNAERTNAVLVEHALTGDSHIAGPSGPGHSTPGWWDALVGPGRALDTNQWFVVAPNVLGGCQGSTGPSSIGPDGRAWGSRFPFITIRDQVTAEARLADHLGIDAWAAVIGGSMGGMRALEWAVGEPERVHRALVLACTAQATADQIAWCHAQVLAIRHDPRWRGGDYYDAMDAGADQGPSDGLGIARRIAHTTYRSEQELTERFGRSAQGVEQPLGGGGRYAVQSYLDHHAAKLVRRFDAGSYVVLTEAMNSHDVSRNRGSVRGALKAVKATMLLAAVNSDRLYPLRLTEEMAASCPRPITPRVVKSDYGHDGFLIETTQVAQLIRELLHELNGSLPMTAGLPEYQAPET
ncbi:MAG: homoserine O-acetyltransferase MetX [Actinomycetota bacterium]